MPEFLPFRGLRYNEQRVGDLTTVAAPPYDILDSEDVKALYGRSPYNVVRIDLGVGEGVGDSDWHGRAGELYRTWRAEGILQQEEAPAYYALKQRYKLPTGQVKELIGVIGACALAPFGEGGVLPHEHTFSKPKEDRFKLMQTTQANISQIYGFFSDPDMTVDQALVEASTRAPVIEVTDDEGNLHQMWPILDTDICKKIAETLGNRPIYIADGHHRYETALAYKNDRTGESTDPHAGWNYVMMFAANLDADGMTILPTHRLLKSGQTPTLSELEQALGQWYEVTEEKLAIDAALAKAQEQVDESTGRIGCYLGNERWVWFVPRNREDLSDAIEGDRSKAVKSLTVTALHELVLTHGFHIDAVTQAEGESIEYLRDAAVGCARVDRSEATALFYVPAPTPSDVTRVAEAGDVMPHKTTYFYPKLLTGLVLNDLNTPVGGLP